MSLEFKKLDNDVKEDLILSANTFQAQTIIMNQYNTTNVTSHNQAGGETVGLKNSMQMNNQIIWKGRKEGFLFGIVSGVIVEIIIRLIF